jgi:hypothetical protein
MGIYIISFLLLYFLNYRLLHDKDTTLCKQKFNIVKKNTNKQKTKPTHS